MGKGEPDIETKKWLEMKWELEDLYCKNIDEKITTQADTNNPNMIYYVDKNTKEIYLEHDRVNSTIRISYNKIWSVFASKHSLNYWQMADLLQNTCIKDEFLGINEKIKFIFWGNNS